MYKIEKKSFGFKLVFADTIEVDEMKRWVTESKKALAGHPGTFGVLVDMRTLRPLKPDVQAVMVEGQKEFKIKGTERSAVALANALIALQFKRLAQESGVYAWEGYIDCSKDPEWEKSGEEWITKRTNPMTLRTSLPSLSRMTFRGMNCFAGSSLECSRRMATMSLFTAVPA